MTDGAATPALPWGAGAATPAAEASGKPGFEEAIRKFLLASMLEKVEQQGGQDGSLRSLSGAALLEDADAAARDEVAAILEDPPVGLQVGKRIEVRWQLTEEDEKTTTKWWGATLVEQKPNESNDFGDRFPLWTLRYDAHGDFKEELSEATFVANRWLLHDIQDEPLVWRTEGEDYEVESDNESNGEEAAAAPDTGVGQATEAAAGEDPAVKRPRGLPVDAINRATLAYEQQLGCSIEAAAMSRMQSSLSAEQQASIAASFSEFTEHVVSKLKEAAEANHDHDITAEDVQGVLASFKRKRGED